MAFWAFLMPSAYALVQLWARKNNLFTPQWYAPAIAWAAYCVALGALAGFFYHRPNVMRVALLVAVTFFAMVPVLILNDAPSYLVFSIVLGILIGTDMATRPTPQTNPPTPDHITSSPE